MHPPGALYYSGYNIDNIVGQVTYEEIVHLLLHNELPNKRELDETSLALFSEMTLPDQVIERLKSTSPYSHPMEILRTEVSHLGEFDPKSNDNSNSANRRRAIRLIAKIPAIVSVFHRVRTKKAPVAPKKEFGFAENFLYMFRGKKVDQKERTTLERYMILHADHGLNASTFAARVTASTNSDMYSCITSAIGTLKGPLHGGASEQVMKLLSEINSLDGVESYIQGMLDDKQRIMGFGHRVYKTEDPRSKHLRSLAKALCKEKGMESIYKKCRKIEDTVRKRKGIFPNVDFYAAVVMNALGIPIEFFTSFFASSRVAGWVAHVLEQYSDAVLIRPTSKYVGGFKRKIVPIENR